MDLVMLNSWKKKKPDYHKPYKALWHLLANPDGSKKKIEKEFLSNFNRTFQEALLYQILIHEKECWKITTVFILGNAQKPDKRHKQDMNRYAEQLSSVY